MQQHSNELQSMRLAVTNLIDSQKDWKTVYTKISPTINAPVDFHLSNTSICVDGDNFERRVKNYQ